MSKLHAEPKLDSKYVRTLGGLAILGTLCTTVSIDMLHCSA